MSDAKEDATEDEGLDVTPQGAEETTDWRDKYLRTLAELDNYRKRSDRERESARRYALEGFMRDLLPLLDSLEAALAADGDLEAIRQGVRLVHQSAMRALADRGLESIEALDQMFDPRFHEAVGMTMDETRAPGTIVREERSGYRLHDRILRPSLVHIVVAPQPTVMESPKSEDSEEPAPSDEE